eukprot:15303354-Ditylum_brightwellii.AAC.1
MRSSLVSFVLPALGDGALFSAFLGVGLIALFSVSTIGDGVIFLAFPDCNGDGKVAVAGCCCNPFWKMSASCFIASVSLMAAIRSKAA